MRKINDSCLNSDKYILENSVDLIVTDPPFAIDTTRNHPTYNRKEEHVVEGYVEIPLVDYPWFTGDWLRQAHRMLKRDGAMFIVSGWTNVHIIGHELKLLQLEVINHIIWKYQFGVVTKNKFVTSHYHIFYCQKQDAKNRTFNRNCRFADDDRTDKGRSMRYADMEDVWVIPREYKPGQKKNRNQLPEALLEKMLSYASNEGDLVVDLFAGSFSTCKVADRMGRKSIGIEINSNMFEADE